MSHLTPHSGRRWPQSVFDGFEFFSPLANFDSGIRADVKETPDSFILEAEMPGYERDEINVETRGDHLVISAERRNEVNEEREGYVRRERRFGSLSRQFYLGNNVDTNNIKAQYRNGVLRIIMPKIEKDDSQRRQIPIE